MEKQNFEVKITLADLVRIFVWRLWVIILVAAVVGGCAFAYFSYTYEPIYKSISRIYILRQNADYNDTAQGYAQSLNAALTTVNDCKMIVKTETTMQKVIDSTGLDYSSSRLLSKVSLSSSDDSRIVLITATASDPATAKLIADTVAVKGVERIKEVMGFDQASIMEEGRLPSSPANSRFSAKIPLITVIAAFLVYVFYLIKFLSNDKISEPEEITDYLGLTVLGVLPNEDEASGKKKYKGYGSYYKYKKYGKSHQYGTPADTNVNTTDTQNASDASKKKSKKEKGEIK